MRIVDDNGNTDGVTRGRWEVFANGTWNAALDSGPTWAAVVICRMLGHGNDGSSMPNRDNSDEGVKIGILRIDCKGHEENVFDCNIEWLKENERLGYEVTPFAMLDCHP